MSYWTITFESPEIAANVARALRAYLFDPMLSGPDPELPTLRYFDDMCESIEYIQKMFDSVSVYGRPISISPPYNYQQICEDLKKLKPKMTLSKIWPSGLFSDLTLKVENVEFKVHRSILASISDYFSALFTSMSESTQTMIELKELDPEVFSRFLDLIYLGIPTDDPLLLPVLILAQRCQIKDLNYEDAVIGFPDPSPDEMPLYVTLLQLIFPNGFPEGVIDGLGVASDLDLSLLPPEEQLRVMQSKEELEKHYSRLDNIRNQRLETLKKRIGPAFTI